MMSGEGEAVFNIVLKNLTKLHQKDLNLKVDLHSDVRALKKIIKEKYVGNPEPEDITVRSDGTR